MSRVLKFRAWNPELAEMIYLENSGLQYYDFEGSYSLGFTVDGYSEFWAHENYKGASENASKFPIMQYTGLKDKNGKEIFEGDILDDCGRAWLVKMLDGGAWALDYKNGSGEKYLHPINKHLEILGNIHQNPDLL